MAQRTQRTPYRPRFGAFAPLRRLYAGMQMPIPLANAWNRLRYTVYAPLYDQVAGFGPQRHRAIELLDPRPGERILIAGAGTGADLPWLPDDVEIVAIDLTPAMVRRTEARAAALGKRVDAHVMDAHALELPPASFDAVVLHLILAVVPDPQAAIGEVARVLKPKGRIVVFDKFAREGHPASLLRRAANVVTHTLFSSITRHLEPLLEGAGFVVTHREPSLFGGLFQIATARLRSEVAPADERPEATA